MWVFKCLDGGWSCAKGTTGSIQPGYSKFMSSFGWDANCYMPRAKKNKPSEDENANAVGSPSPSVDFILTLPLPLVRCIRSFLTREDLFNWKLVCPRWLAVYRSTVRKITLRRLKEFHGKRCITKPGMDDSMSSKLSSLSNGYSSLQKVILRGFPRTDRFHTIPKSITTLFVSECTIDDSNVANLPPSLVKLSLYDAKVEESCYQFFSSLQKLQLTEVRIEGPGLSVLTRLSRLELDKAAGLEDLSGLTAIQSLHKLGLRSSIKKDCVLDGLKLLTQVKDLDLSLNKITEIALNFIPTSVTSLNLRGCDDISLNFPLSFPNLVKLDLFSVKISDMIIPSLSSTLIELSISGDSITEHAFENIQCTNLKVLDIYHWSATSNYHVLPASLTSLKLCNTHPTSLANLPRSLEHFELDSSRVKNEVIEELSSLENLRELRLYRAANLSDKGLRKLPPNLKVLNVGGCKHVTKRMVNALKKIVPTVYSVY